jgi:DNA invertase Pin-like site-specific DNA recombinase
MSRQCLAYARVSTTRDQSVDAQLHQLSTVAASRGVTLVTRTEAASGRKDRPVLEEIERHARQGRVAQLWVVGLDRLGRSTIDVLMRLDRLQRAGCAVVSLREGIDLTTAAGRLQAQMLSAVAEFEAALIRERTIQGLAAARARGRRLGRRERAFDVELAARLRGEGLSWSQLSRQLRVPASTIRDRLAEIPPSDAGVPNAV